MTDVIVYAYSPMKITRVSLQSKLDELISLLTRILHPASIAVKHALFSSSNTCGRIKEVSTLKSSSFDCSETRTIFIEGYVWENKRSSSSIDCSETHVIFIEVYVSTVKSVHPTSIAV